MHGYSCNGEAGRCVQEPEFATGGLAPLTVAQVTAASSLVTVTSPSPGGGRVLAQAQPLPHQEQAEAALCLPF